MSDSAARAKLEPAPYTVSLQIKHPTIDPETITKELGLTPDHSWACGEPKRSSSSAAPGGVRRNSFWCATLAPIPPVDERFSVLRDSAKFQRALEMMSSDLSSHLNVQLVLLRRHQAFIQGMMEDGGELSFVIELPTTDLVGFKLDPSITRQLAALGATLEFQFV